MGRPILNKKYDLQVCSIDLEVFLLEGKIDLFLIIS